MGIPLRVIVVENSKEDVESLLIELCRGGYEVTCDRVDTAAGMTTALSEAEWDIVIADCNIPNFGVLAALELLQKNRIDLPFITLSNIDEDLAMATMKAGAKDYILKDKLHRLIPIVERELRESKVRRERNQLKETLRQSEERFLQLAENITEVFWMSSTDEGGILYISPVYEKVWGRSHKSLYEQPTTWVEAIHPEDRDRIERAIMTHQLLWIQQGLGTYDEEYRIIRPDGSIRWIRDRAFPVKDASGQVYRIAGIAEDITERKQAEETRLHLSSIVESSEDAIISSTPDGIIQSWNRGAERIFGYSAQEVIGRPISILIPPDRIEEAAAILKRINQGEHIDPYETVRIRKDGQRLDVSVTISPIKDHRDRIMGASKISRDITQQKQAEREREELLTREQKTRLEAQEANRLKDEFLAIISDELRTQLNANYGWTQLLRIGALDFQRQQRVLEALQQNARAREHLIQALLDVSHIISGKLRLQLRPVNLAPIIEAAVETVRPAAEDKGIGIKVRLDPSIGPLMIDPVRLQQIVWNLLCNAIKFTPDKGCIEIFLEQVSPYFQIRVKDNGIGISSDFLPHMFDLFRRAEGSGRGSQRGLGLGLAIVQHLVKLHGGSVLAESAGEGKGATITIKIPIRTAQTMEDDSRPIRSPAKEASASGKLQARHNWHLLLVDDELDVRTLLTIALEEYGIHVTSAASAQEAMEILERKRLDLLISDIRMPIKDGFALLEKIRESEKQRGLSNIPVIALTSFARDDEQEQALSAGFQAYIPKQVKPDMLVTIIEELINQSTRSAS